MRTARFKVTITVDDTAHFQPADPDDAAAAIFDAMVDCTYWPGWIQSVDMVDGYEIEDDR